MSKYIEERFRVTDKDKRKSQWFDADQFYYTLHADGDLTIHNERGKTVAAYARYMWISVTPDLVKVEH